MLEVSLDAQAACLKILSRDTDLDIFKGPRGLKYICSYTFKPLRRVISIQKIFNKKS